MAGKCSHSGRTTFWKTDMLFVFNRPNGLHIAWHSQGPSNKSRFNQNANSSLALIRTRSAG